LQKSLLSVVDESSKVPFKFLIFSENEEEKSELGFVNFELGNSDLVQLFFGSILIEPIDRNAKSNLFDFRRGWLLILNFTIQQKSLLITRLFYK